MEILFAKSWTLRFDILSVYEISVLFAGMNCFAVLQREFCSDKTYFTLLEVNEKSDYMKYRAVSFVDGKYDWINVIHIHKDCMSFGIINLMDGLLFISISDKFEINSLMGVVYRCD